MRVELGGQFQDQVVVGQHFLDLLGQLLQTLDDLQEPKNIDISIAVALIRFQADSLLSCRFLGEALKTMPLFHDRFLNVLYI